MFEVKWIFLFQNTIYRYEWRNESWSYYLINPADRVSVTQSASLTCATSPQVTLTWSWPSRCSFLSFPWTTHHLCLSRSEHNLTYTKEWSVLIMMKKKHNKIQVKFSHLKTLHNGVDADWRCIFYRLGKFQSPSQGSRKGRNQKSPRLQLFRAG